MKKRLLYSTFFVVIFLSAFSKGVECNLDAKMVNQDPYPALPGEYVEVVIQLDGIASPECGTINFEFVQEFPFSLDPGVSPIIEIQSGTYASGFKSALVIPYRIRVHENALEGKNSFGVIYNSRKSGRSVISTIKEFNITVEDVRTDFEISIKDFNYETNIMTIEILNIGEHDVEALTVDLPLQDNLEVKGSRRNIAGSLDANEDTTVTFEVIPRDGEITLEILYTDEINVRRILEKTLVFNSAYFTGRKADESQSKSPWLWVSIVLFILIILLWFSSWYKKRKRTRMRHYSTHGEHDGHSHHTVKKR